MDYQNEHETIYPLLLRRRGKAEKILICRDSFGVHMAEYFARNYPDVTLMDYRTEDCRDGAAELRLGCSGD